MPEPIICQERMYLNTDKTKVVGEGKDAAFLYASKGDTIPQSAAERFGIEDGKLPKGGKKSKAAPPNKEKKPAEDKSGAKGDAK